MSDVRTIRVFISSPGDLTVERAAFKQVLEELNAGFGDTLDITVRTNVLSIASPILNGRVERFIQTIKYECLFKFILFGQRHLDHIVSEFVDYYNGRRSHMERDHLPPIRKTPDEVFSVTRDKIEIRSYVGGLVQSFERKAA